MKLRLAIALSAALFVRSHSPAADAPARVPETDAFSGRPDVVLILVDSLRPDHLGCYGYERDTSPAIDRFASGSAKFTEAVASAPWTQPSIMSLFTSSEPGVHGRIHWEKPHADIPTPTLAEAFRAAGYRTAAVVANPMVHRKYGFSRGFDEYDDHSLAMAASSGSEPADMVATGDDVVLLAKKALDRRREDGRPLFLFVLFMDVHWDYLPPPPYDALFAPDPVPAPRKIWERGGRQPEPVEKRIVAAYDGEIRYEDGCVGALLDAVSGPDKPGNAIVAFCSDHGDAFWEHGFTSHGNSLFEEEIRVPLMVRPSGSSGWFSPCIVTDSVGLIDLGPTLLDLAGLPVPGSWQGRSLVPAMRGEAFPDKPVVLDNRVGADKFRRGVRTRRWKISSLPPFDRPDMVFDLSGDSGEKCNLAGRSEELPEEVRNLVPLLAPPRPAVHAEADDP